MTTGTLRRLIFTIFLVIANLGSAAWADGTAQHNKTLVIQAMNEFAAGKAGIFDLMAPDLRWTIEGSGTVAGTYNSKEEFIKKAARPILSRLAGRMQIALSNTWAEGDDAIIKFTGHALARDGKSFRSVYLWILTMRNGVIVSGTAFLDLTQYDRVLRDVTPAPNYRLPGN